MNNKEKLERVLELLTSDKALEAKKIFEQLDPEETVEYLMVSGKLKHKFQKFGEAINAFSKVLELEPENHEAENNLHLIQNILNFWNPEMFNPQQFETKTKVEDLFTLGLAGYLNFFAAHEK